MDLGGVGKQKTLQTQIPNLNPPNISKGQNLYKLNKSFKYFFGSNSMIRTRATAIVFCSAIKLLK